MPFKKQLGLPPPPWLGGPPELPPLLGGPLIPVGAEGAGLDGAGDHDDGGPDGAEGFDGAPGLFPPLPGEGPDDADGV